MMILTQVCKARDPGEQNKVRNRSHVLKLTPCLLITLELPKIAEGGVPLIQPLTSQKEHSWSKLAIDVSSPLSGETVISGV